MRHLFAVDIDGVLYDVIEHTRQFVKDKYNKIVPVSSITSTNMAYFTDDEEINRDLINQLSDSHFYDSMKPIDCAWEALNLLRTMGPVIAITKRKLKMLNVTTCTLVRDFGDLIISNKGPNTLYFYNDGPDRARRLGVTTMMEDSFEMAKKYAKKGILTYHVGGLFGTGGRQYFSAWLRSVKDVLEAAKDVKHIYEGAPIA